MARPPPGRGRTVMAAPWAVVMALTMDRPRPWPPETLQRAESEFEPVPFDVEAARAYGRVAAAVIAAGRKPRRRIADLMIAATAIAEDLPLFTTNPDDHAAWKGSSASSRSRDHPLPHEKKP
jgi:hypothetical protein